LFVISEKTLRTKIKYKITNKSRILLFISQKAPWTIKWEEMMIFARHLSKGAKNQKKGDNEQSSSFLCSVEAAKNPKKGR
jgi:hypothetical protein